ncbi:MAG: hypothetical protein HGA63_09235, partial [Syntrophobacteraceae bacterium]|nr:hypothetical protein [Syntrophobacteraceae bacterium]
IEILTGMEAGKLQEDGSYPEGTLFRKVDDRLKEIMEIVREYGKDVEKDQGKKKNEEEAGGCPHCGG